MGDFEKHAVFGSGKVVEATRTDGNEKAGIERRAEQ